MGKIFVINYYKCYFEPLSLLSEHGKEVCQ